MARIFVGGSRAITSLPAPAIPRLQTILDKDFPVLVGDAPGADTDIQRFLVAADYRNVTVFCSGLHARNNLGSWPIAKVAVPYGTTGFQFHAAKDRRMAELASHGFMLWDGRSPGTVLNVMRMAIAGKTAVLLDTPRQQFMDFKSQADWRHFFNECPPALKRNLEARLSPLDRDR